MKVRCAQVFELAIVIVTFLYPHTYASQKGNQVIIKRDHYGVPHIYANSVYNLFYGYAVAEDRLFSMEIAKRTGQGRMAEVLAAGPKDKYIKFDQKIRSRYNPESIKQQLRNLSQEDRDVFDGYAAGINAYPDDRALNVTEGIVRARFRNSIWGKPLLIQPGKIYEYKIELLPIAIIFRKGHRIRIHVSSSSWPL